MCIACDKECGLSRNREQLFEKERSAPTFEKNSGEGVRRQFACRRWTLRSHRSAPGTRLLFRASAVTPDVKNRHVLRCVGPTTRSGSGNSTRQQLRLTMAHGQRPDDSLPIDLDGSSNASSASGRHVARFRRMAQSQAGNPDSAGRVHLPSLLQVTR